MNSSTYPSKYASPKGLFTVGKTRFKWYDLAADPVEITAQEIYITFLLPFFQYIRYYKIRI